MNDYGGYAEWKKWKATEFAELSESDEAYFDNEIGRVKADIASALEIGFGNGNFYAWCRKNGIRYAGVESQKELVERGAKAGMEAHERLDAVSGRFDLVAAFDVFEHMPSEELLRVLKQSNDLLSEDGIVLARFPNGDSFLSMECQNGDYTHVNWIGSGKIAGLAEAAGLELVSYRPIFIPARTPKEMAAAASRFLIENLVSLLMFKSFGRTTAANVVAVLRKKKAARS